MITHIFRLITIALFCTFLFTLPFLFLFSFSPSIGLLSFLDFSFHLHYRYIFLKFCSEFIGLLDLLGFKSLINSKNFLAIITLRIASSSWSIFFLKIPLYVYWKSFPNLLVSLAQLNSVTQSCPTLWDPMDSSTPGPLSITNSWVYSNSCPLSQRYHPTISSSVVPFSFLQSFPASGSFQMSQFFASGGQSIGVSASASVFPMNNQDWSPSGWTCLNLSYFPSLSLSELLSVRHPPLYLLVSKFSFRFVWLVHWPFNNCILFIFC